MSDRKEFSLLTEPWILAQDQAGVISELSIYDVFRNATSMKTIVGDLPTQGFAIFRVLMAILHRAVDGPADRRAWRTLQNAGSPPLDRIESYLAKHADRFDLFSSAMPFMQVADLHTAKHATSGIEKLIADVPAGNKYFTMRAGDGLKKISAAEAVRWVIHAQAFDVSGIKSGAEGDDRVQGGRGYPIGIGWSGHLGGLYVEGENLWETFLANLIPYDQPTLAQFGPQDRPAWEAAPSTSAQASDIESRPYGPLDLYTWQSRRIRLVGDATGVTAVVLANGDRLTPQNQWKYEPMTSWRRSEPQQKKLGLPLVYMPREHDPTRAFWRGLEAALPMLASRSAASDGQKFVSSGVVSWARYALHGRGTVRLHAIGMEYGGQSATFANVIDDHVDVSLAMLQDTRTILGSLATRMIDATNDGVLALRNLASNLAKATGASPGDDALLNGKRDRASEMAYAALDQPFRQWLVRLDEDTDPDAARADWTQTAQNIIVHLGERLVDNAGPTAWLGREVGGWRITSPEADNWFRRDLAKALPQPKPLATSLQSEDTNNPEESGHE